MDIIIVEDDPKVGNFLKENLSRDNSVNLISDYNELRTYIESSQSAPSLFIMDRLLGNDDTKKLLKNLKQRFPQSMVLYLSAINTPQEKALLLDEGADDYLGKPFSLVELQARVRSLQRRIPESSNSGSSFFLHIGDTIIDMKSRHVICNGQKIDLTHKEFLLMLNFCENKNRVFSKYQLLDLIWETNLDIESNVIEVNIMNLRKKIENSGSALKILSKRNVGYWLEA